MVDKLQALSLGTEGEAHAGQYLESKGLKVLDRHYHTRWGEIDLICKDGDDLVFVEVKTRAHTSDFPALDAITLAKQKKIAGAAMSYVKQHRLKDQNLRFDVVILEERQVEWLKGAFDSPMDYTY
jgi:putative endonuclease